MTVRLIMDIDGTIANAFDPWQDAVWDMYGVIVPESSIRIYDLAKASHSRVSSSSGNPPNSYEEYETYLDNRCFFNPDYYRSMRPYFEFWRLITESWEQGVLYMTARSPRFRAPTHAWLEKYGFSNAEKGRLCMTKDKQKEVLRLAMANRKESYIFIDDKLSTAREVADLDLANVRVFVPERRWNELTDVDVTRNEEALRSHKTPPIQRYVDWAICAEILRLNELEGCPF